jgi:hypothetical protein
MPRKPKVTVARLIETVTDWYIVTGASLSVDVLARTLSCSASTIRKLVVDDHSFLRAELEEKQGHRLGSYSGQYCKHYGPSREHLRTIIARLKSDLELAKLGDKLPVRVKRG